MILLHLGYLCCVVPVNVKDNFQKATYISTTFIFTDFPVVFYFINLFLFNLTRLNIPQSSFYSLALSHNIFISPDNDFYYGSEK